MAQATDKDNAGEAEDWEWLVGIAGLLLPILVPVALVVVSFKSDAVKGRLTEHVAEYTEEIVIGIAFFLAGMYLVLRSIRSSVSKGNGKLLESGLQANQVLLDAMDMRNDLGNECHELCDIFRNAKGVQKLRNTKLVDIISGKSNEFYIPTCDENERLDLLTMVSKECEHYVFAYNYFSETYLDRFFFYFRKQVDAYLNAHREAYNKGRTIQRIFVVPDSVLQDKSSKSYSLLVALIELHKKHNLLVQQSLFLVLESDVLAGLNTCDDEGLKEFANKRLKTSFFLCDELVFSHDDRYVSATGKQSVGNVSLYRNVFPHLPNYKAMFKEMLYQSNSNPMQL